MERIDDLQFEGLKLVQDSEGYCFTSDSVLLANYVKCPKSAKVVEFCAGSGVISVLLTKKQHPKIIHAFEILKEPYELFLKSVKLNGLEDIIKVHNLPLENWSEVLPSGFADVVVVNPPYLEKKDDESLTQKRVAVSELLTNLESVVKSASEVLKFGGKLFMVHRTDRLVDVLVTLRKYKLEPKRLSIVYPKENAEPVVFLVEAVSGGKKGVRVSPSTQLTGNAL